MDILKVLEGTDEVRVEIMGPFVGEPVEAMKSIWQQTVTGTFWRHFVVDISGLTGYDLEGHSLLHQLCRHGAKFVARSASSLAFLQEVTDGVCHQPLTSLRILAERAAGPRPRHRSGLKPMPGVASYR